MSVTHYDKVVAVTIERQTAGVTRTGFGVPLLWTAHPYWGDRYRTFDPATALDDFAKLGVPTNSYLSRAMSAIKQMSRKPKTVAVGRRAICETLFIVDTTAAETATLSFELCDATVAFDVTIGDDPQTIAGAVKSAIDDAVPALDTVVLDLPADPEEEIALVRIRDNRTAVTRTGLWWSDLPAGMGMNASLRAKVRVKEVDGDGTYEIKVLRNNGKERSIVYTADGDTSASDIRAGLLDTVDDDGLLAGMADASATDTFFVGIHADEGAADFGMEKLNFFTGADDKLEVTFPDETEPAEVVVESWAESMAAIRRASTDFYGVVPLTRSLLDQRAAADVIEAQPCLGVVGSPDYRIVETTVLEDTDTVAAYLKSNARKRCAAIYHANLEGRYVAGEKDNDDWRDAAWCALMLTYDLDVQHVTWAHKELAGMAASDLKSGELDNILAKKCNAYVEIGGLNRTLYGTTGDGDYLDVTAGCDWIDMRLTEDVWQVLANAAKVPYTDPGIAMIEAALRKRMGIALAVGFLRPAPEEGKEWQPDGVKYVIPRVADITPTDRASRALSGIGAEAKIAGAIHRVDLEIRVSV
jgi:hypothetical protein